MWLSINFSDSLFRAGYLIALEYGKWSMTSVMRIEVDGTGTGKCPRADYSDDIKSVNCQLISR